MGDHQRCRVSWVQVLPSYCDQALPMRTDLGIYTSGRVTGKVFHESQLICLIFLTLFISLIGF